MIFFVFVMNEWKSFFFEAKEKKGREKNSRKRMKNGKNVMFAAAAHQERKINNEIYKLHEF